MGDIEFSNLLINLNFAITKGVLYEFLDLEYFELIELALVFDVSEVLEVFGFFEVLDFYEIFGILEVFEELFTLFSLTLY